MLLPSLAENSERDFNYCNKSVRAKRNRSEILPKLFDALQFHSDAIELSKKVGDHFIHRNRRFNFESIADW